jgi:putative oxidoreductase
MSYGILLLRVVVGLAFVGHGTQKLFGWFGGYGPKGTGGFFASQGYRAPVLMAVTAGLSEAAGGTLLALGFATPLAGAMLAIVMINAIGSVTFKKAFMFGSELEIAYLTIAGRSRQSARAGSRSTARSDGMTTSPASGGESPRSAPRSSSRS